MTATSGTRSSSMRSALPERARLPDVEVLLGQLFREHVGELRLVLDE